jgi:hypothetical protein
MLLKESQLRGIIREAILEYIAEAQGIQSKKIYDIIQQHGGLAKDDIRYKICDLHNLADQDVVGVISFQQLSNIQNQQRKIDHGKWIEGFGLKDYAIKKGFNLRPQDDAERIKLNDGNYLIVILRNGRFDMVGRSHQTNDGWKNYYDKTEARRKNQRADGRNEYIPTTPVSKAAQELRKNPYFRSKEDGWADNNVRRNAINYARQGKNRWGGSNI